MILTLRTPLPLGCAPLTYTITFWIVAALLAMRVGACAGTAAADPSPPLTHATARERDYWNSLVTCRLDLTRAEIRLEGAREKTRTTTTTINLTCPAFPACPPAAPSDGASCWSTTLLGIAGGAAVGVLACSALTGGPSVVVAH